MITPHFELFSLVWISFKKIMHGGINVRTETMTINEFMNRDVKRQLPKELRNRKDLKFFSVAAGIWMVFAPQVAGAQVEEETGDMGFDRVVKDFFRVVDWLLVGVIIFAGTSWMFGNRTKGIEMLIGGSSGYLIARHAIEIKDWLKALTPEGRETIVIEGDES